MFEGESIMATNVNPAAPSIQPASRSSETKTDKIAVSRDGGSSSGFAKQTDVKFTNSVDNMSAVLEKISTAKLGNDNGLPQQLREMINNIVTKAFSLESSLGEGLGSAMASERYSVEQLTSLGRIFQQLGNMAEANAVAGQVSGETTAGQLSDALQTMMANVKTLLANNALGGNTADLELVQLTKLAFQVLNNGNTGNMPQKLEALLQMLAGQQMGQTPEGGTASQTVSQPNAQEGTVKKLVDLLFPKLSASNSSQVPANPQPSQGQSASNTAGQNPQMNTVGTAESATVGAKASQTNVSSETIIKTGSQSTGQTNVVTSETPAKTGAQPAGENIQQNQQNQQAGVSPKVLHQAAELENNPLFKQIFSRYGYSQETGVVRQPTQTAQQEIPQLPNNQQVVDSFRNLAELLLKDSNLTAKDMTLLKNFVNSSQTQLSQQDAKQLNLLLKMVQSNVPAAIQQAGQQPGMEGLPKLWAFLQLADLGSLKDLKAKDFKNANKEIKTPQDLAGLKIRVMTNEPLRAMFTNAGAVVTNVSFSELYQALQLGTCEAEENPFANIRDKKFYEVQSYMCVTMHSHTAEPLVMSKELFDGLPAEDQAMFQEAGLEASKWAYQHAKEVDAENREYLEGQMTVIEPDRELWKDFAAQTNASYEANYTEAAALKK